MTICKYYQQGRCKFGNQCKYEHIDPPGGPPDPFNKQPNQSRSDTHQGARRNETRIFWPLSAVGFEENPEQGNVLDNDYSAEELRVMAYSMAARGRGPNVSQKEAAIVAEQQQKMHSLGLIAPSASNQNHHQQNIHAQKPEPKDPFANAPPQNNNAFSLQFQANGAASNPFSPTPSQAAPAFQPSNPFAQPSAFQSMQPQSFVQSHQEPQQMSAFPATPQAQPQPPQAPQQQLFPMQHSTSPQMSAQPAQPAQPLQLAPNSQAEQQFNAAQFGFAKVPESAPPPQFY